MFCDVNTGPAGFWEYKLPFFFEMLWLGFVTPN